MAVILQDVEVPSGLEVAQVVGKVQGPLCDLVKGFNSVEVPVTSKKPGK